MQDNKTFKVGAGKAIITPKLGTRLYGYPSDRFATSIHDDLTTTAVAISDGTETILVFASTICSMPEELCARAKAMVQEKTGVSKMIFSVNHTHSGPALTNTAAWGNADTDYIENILLPGLLKAAIEAVENMEDAKMGVGQIETRTGTNRRKYLLSGGISLYRNTQGIYDPRMCVISFKAADDSKYLASIVHFGCHGTAAGGPHPDAPVTRDWSGVMTDRLEWMTGAPCAFLLGAEGDVSPRDFNREHMCGEPVLNTVDQAMEVGGMAAVDAAEALTEIREYFVPEMKIQTGEIRLTYEPLPDAEEARKALKRLDEEEVPAHMAYKANYERNRWQKVLEEEGKEKKEAFCYDQILLQLGPVVIVPHPFEIFTAISMRLDYASPVKYTLSLANANGACGYLPNKEEFCRGGYEIWSSRYRTAYILTEDADSELIKQNLALIKQMQ